jgi:peroxiredoxin
LATVADFIEENDYSFPALLDTDDNVSLDYGVSGIPVTFFIDKAGIIRAKKIGGFLNTTEIENYLGTIMP